MTAAFTTEQQFFIKKLRSMLSMRFDTTAAGSSFTLPNKLGDEEVWEDLLNGLSMFNTWPPILTGLTLRDLYTASGQEAQQGGDPLAPEIDVGYSLMLMPVMMCAMFMTGIRLQLFEAGKHFVYNDNGLYIERKKQQDYANINGGSILQYLTASMTNLRKVIALERIHPKGQFSSMISFPRSLTRGLRGTRLGIGS
jgi:hypothetical protein